MSFGVEECEMNKREGEKSGWTLKKKKKRAATKTEQSDRPVKPNRTKPVKTQPTKTEPVKTNHPHTNKLNQISP